MEKVVTAEKNKTLVLIGVVVAVVLCILLALIFGSAFGSSAGKLAEQLELGQQYLSELDYEQAVVAYEAVLKIDHKNEEAYLGLAEAYVAMGDSARATEVLEEGYAQTASERIGQKLRELNESLQVENSGGERNSDNVETTDDTETQAQMPEDHVMDWKDANLEATMRWITGIEEGDIMLSDVWSITKIIFNIHGYKISDVSALAELSNLTYLDLSHNEICDISALSSLTNLTYLDLSWNQISDITALSSLTNLTDLWLDGNQITDISGLSSLANLRYLRLQDNQVEDVSSLAGLTNLDTLLLGHNQIRDISPLAELSNLTTLWVENNKITDPSLVSFVENLLY